MIQGADWRSRLKLLQARPGRGLWYVLASFA